MRFKPGDMVRIGGRVTANDINYHKRGIVAPYENGCLVVNMIEPFKNGATRITWLSENCMGTVFGCWRPFHVSFVRRVYGIDI